MVIRAASLTFYTVMAIVPLLAISFGIAKGFGLQQFLEEGLMERFPQQHDILKEIIPLADSALEKTKGGVIASFALIFLLWYTARVILRMDKTMHLVWKIKQRASWRRLMGDYFTIMLVVPLFFIISGMFEVVILKQLHSTIFAWATPNWINSFIWFWVKLFPYLLVIVTFIFLYLFLPKIKVKFTSALLGGIVAGIVYLLLQYLYIRFQVGVMRYSAIYGSFAALPLLLIWIQLSWVIFFYGCELSFSMQNVQLFEFEKSYSSLSYNCRLKLSLWIVHQCVHHFLKKKSPIDIEEISNRLHVPLCLTRNILDELTIAGVFTRVGKKNGKENQYQFSVFVETLKIKDVIDVINSQGIKKLPWIKAKSLSRINKCLTSFDKAIEKSDGNVCFKDIVN